MMTARTLTLAALSTAVLLGLGAPAGAQQAAEIRIGTVPESYPPFTQVEANGELKGFEIDLGNALCAEMKVTCRWVLQAWDGIIPALQESKFDAIIASMSITAERKQVIDFSEKYYDTPAMFVGRKDEKIDITPASLKGRTVGVQVSTVHASYVEAKFKDILKMTTYDTLENANLDLIAGRVDLLMADSIALQDGLLNTKDGADFEVKGQPFTDPILGDGAGVGVRKADTALRDRFSAAIKAVRANGTYKAINDKYFKFDAYGG